MAKDTSNSKNQAPVMDLGADLSPALHAIERAYRLIQKRFPDAPDVTIVIKRDERAWGHTTVAKVWAPAAKDGQADRFEIMISGENLRRGAVAVAGTLLHEAAHARNLANGVLDTDMNGRHNRQFAATAEAHGLTVTQRGWHGFAQTELEADGQAAWTQLVKVIATGLAKSAATAAPSIDHLPTPEAPATPPKPVKGPDGEIIGKVPATPRKRGNRNLLKATCGCGHSIRLSRGVWDLAQPTCQECSQVFELHTDAA
jgi:hypothetical protein